MGSAEKRLNRHLLCLYEWHRLIEDDEMGQWTN